MSTHSNPFAQGGWNGQFASGPEWTGEPPSTLGALPAHSNPSHRASNSGRVTFQFVNPSPNILNSVVIGSGNRPIFKVTTDNSMPGYTTFKDTANKVIAFIEWRSPAAVEIRGSVPKGPAREWLRVTVDPRINRAVRVMYFRGSRFIWMPYNECLHLYSQSSPTPCVVVEKTRNVVNLEMTSEAIAQGLLEPSVVAVTLLLSGQSLE